MSDKNFKVKNGLDVVENITVGGSITKTGGTSSQFLKADGSVDSTSYAVYPSQTGNNGKYLTTDGTTTSWGTISVPISSGTATISANTATTVDTVAIADFGTIEYTLSIRQGTKTRSSKVMVQDNGTTVDFIEYAVMETGGTMSGITVSASLSSTNSILQITITDAATTNATVKFTKVVM